MNETNEDKLIRHLKRSSYEDVCEDIMKTAEAVIAQSQGEDNLTEQELVKILSRHNWSHKEYLSERTERLQTQFKGFFRFRSK